MRLPLLVLLLAALAACGGDGPTEPKEPQIPNLVGTYDGSWTYTASAPGYQTETTICSGRITVQSQSGGSFTGTYSQASSQDCGAESGNLSGNVAAGGALTMGVSPASGGPTWEERTGCTITAAASQYSGSYVGGVLSCGASFTATCPQMGDVTLTMQIDFSGS